MSLTVRQLVERLGLTVQAGADHIDHGVSGGYVGDLMSDVIANSRAGDAWITIQSHENTIAVAGLRDLACIILVGGERPDEETVRRAEEKGIPILATEQRAFEVVKALIEAGVTGRSEA